MAQINVSFNGTSFQTANILTSAIEHESLPTRQLYQYQIARGDGSKITFSQYTDKPIKLAGRLIGSSTTDLDSRIDTFRNVMGNGQDLNLDIDWNGGTRRYVGTVKNIAISRSGLSPLAAAFSVEYSLTSPFGKDTTTTTSLNAVVLTTTPNTQSFTAIGGSYKALPVITALLNSGTGLTTQTMTLKNTATTQQIAITRTWTAADSLVIDCSAQTCKVNGTDVDYSGVFPYWDVSSTQITYSDTFTTRNISLTFAYTKRWL